jgi:hypothetical protein
MLGSILQVINPFEPYVNYWIFIAGSISFHPFTEKNDMNTLHTTHIHCSLPDAVFGMKIFPNDIELIVDNHLFLAGQLVYSIGSPVLIVIPPRLAGVW